MRTQLSAESSELLMWILMETEISDTI